jgi:hypothetical protein
MFSLFPVMIIIRLVCITLLEDISCTLIPISADARCLQNASFFSLTDITTSDMYFYTVVPIATVIMSSEQTLSLQLQL